MGPYNNPTPQAPELCPYIPMPQRLHTVKARETLPGVICSGHVSWGLTGEEHGNRAVSRTPQKEDKYVVYAWPSFFLSPQRHHKSPRAFPRSRDMASESFSAQGFWQELAER